MYYILFNAKAAGGTGEKTARKLEEILKGEELVFKSVHEMDYRRFFAEVDPEAKIVLVGGDGTLNYFVNDIRRVEVKNEIYFFAGGTGHPYFSTDTGAALRAVEIEADCIPASGPISPRPSTAVPSVMTATRLLRLVSVKDLS